MFQNEQTAIIGEAVAGESAAVRQRLEALINNLERNKLDIGDLLHRIKKAGYYNQWGFNTFAEFQGTLNIKPRTAQYLRKISEVMELVDLPREQYETVGVGKLRAITSLDPTATWVNPEDNSEVPMRDFILGLVERAAEMPVEEIWQYVRTLNGRTGENDLVFLNVSLTRAALEYPVRPALEAAKALIGSAGKDDEGISQDASDGAALEALAADFLAANPYGES